MVKVLVINIKSAAKRLEYIQAQLAEIDVVPERIEAVNGKTDDHPYFRRYNEKLRIARKGTPLSPGQLGCFASHMLAWERCIELDAPVVVLEDDVTLVMPEFREFLTCCSDMDRRFECVRLFENRTKHHHAIAASRLSQFQVVKYTKGPMSGMGYYLNPRGASKLLAHADNWFLAVDMYADRFWQHGVECYGVMPPCVKHDYLFDSMIGYDSKKNRRKLLVRVKREAFSLSENIRRFLHNFKFRVWLLLSKFPRN